MRLTTAEFQGNANSLDALTAKNEKLNDIYEQQKAKAEGLAARIKLLEENNLGASKAADDYRANLNNTKAAMIELERQIRDNNRYLDEARRSADRAATSIDGFGREVADVDDQTAGFGKALGGVISDLGKLKGAIAGGAAIGALKEMGGAILELEESTREYRQSMNGLISAGEQAGISAEQTTERYMTLQGVMNDTQAAAEATAQLQTLSATEEQLNEATIGVIGAWSKLGGAAPIETIAESISQTVAAAQATGAFSDILMATGQSEDEFNEKLSESKDSAERLDLVLRTLSETGMYELGESYLKNNQQAIEATQAQERLNASYAALGEVLVPVANLLRNGLALAVDFATEKIGDAIKAVQELSGWWSKTRNALQEMSGWNISNLWSALTTTPAQQAAAAATARGLATSQLYTKSITDSSGLSDNQVAARGATGASDAMAYRGAGITINLTAELDGEVVARNQTTYNARQSELAGKNMID